MPEPAEALADIERLETSLWEAADHLRANSKLTSSEYAMPVLGVIFLRHATNRYDAAREQIEADQSAGRMPKRPLTKDDFIRRRALMLPEVARYDVILGRPKGTDFGRALIQAMEAVEAQFPPLQGQLPKEYDRFEAGLLEDLLRIFDREELRRASGDVFGRIYEYFLMKFAMQGAQDNGEFFTPPSLVQTIVNVIEPDHGVVFDPACGSGGMFVQSSHFVEARGEDTARRVTFYGQEKTGTTIRLAKMNLAVHGLEGDIREANTFYDDVHRLEAGKALWGNCDFVMANPPFNVDMVDAERVKTDRRLLFGLPGVNAKKKVSNGNYLWISYFYSYLGPKGRAGFVMSSQASSAGHGEADVRRKLVETGAVDVMIAIRSNFFYTRTVPCELWHLDKGKPKERQDQVLMIDARQIYRKVTRKIYDFSPEQLLNISAIVWLYRGQNERFLRLVEGYLKMLHAQCGAAEACLEVFENRLAPVMADLSALAGKASEPRLREALHAIDEAHQAWLALLTSCAKEFPAFARRIEKKAVDTNEAQRGARTAFEPLAERYKSLARQTDVAYKLCARGIDVAAELDPRRAGSPLFDTRAAVRKLKQLDEDRKDVVDECKGAVHMHREIAWLQDGFPDARMRDVPGLCKVVTRAEIEKADWSLTPGRYVGVAPPEVDEDFDFEQAIKDIHSELADLNAEAVELAATIQTNIEELA